MSSTLRDAAQLKRNEQPPVDTARTSPSCVEPAAWVRASRALITQLQDPQDRTALRRRLTEVHHDSTRGFAEPPNDPAALDTADLYGLLTEI